MSNLLRYCNYSATVPRMNDLFENVERRMRARLVGEKLFASCIPCAAGHVADRYVRNDACAVCAREAGNARISARREEHNARRRAREREKSPASSVRRVYAPRVLGRSPSERLAATQEANRRYKEKLRAERPEVLLAASSKHRATKRRATPKWFSSFDRFVFEEAHALARRRTRSMGVQWHVDHMIPLAGKKASGLHVGSNAQVIPAVLNNHKKARMLYTEPFEWLAAL